MKIFLWFAFVLLQTAAYAAEKANVPSLVSEHKAVLLDVREDLEATSSGIIAGAIVLPTSDMEDNTPRNKKVMTGLDKHKKVFIYCEKGGRARVVAEKLKGLGYDAESLGGMRDVAKLGMPIAPYKQ